MRKFVCESAHNCTVTDCPHRVEHEYDISCSFGRCEMAAEDARCSEVDGEPAYCDTCQFLSLSEAEQQSLKKRGYDLVHKCLFYNQERVRHLGRHPHIVKLEFCEGPTQRRVVEK
jgi:hypothetical protein